MGMKYRVHKNAVIFFGLFSFFVFTAVPAAFAQSPGPIEAIEPGVTPPEKFYRAEVLEVYQAERENVPGYLQKVEIVKLKIASGDEKGKEVEAESLNYSQSLSNCEAFKLTRGEKVLVGKLQNLDEPFYYIADKYRLPYLFIIFVSFLAVALGLGRLRAFTSIVGLIFSIFMLAVFIVPSILEGRNPLLVSLAGAFVIAIVSLFLAHGFNKRAAVALFSTLITLSIAAGLSYTFVIFSKLFGLSSEEAFYLQAFPGANINLQGLLIGAIIIGTLGVLDDVTVTQVAAVEEIGRADSSLSTAELYKRGLSIGHEHIAALINTLALAYAGVSLPLFVLFTLSGSQPLWVILNGELVAEEVVRTLVGSIAIILAVPISTFLAAYFLRSKVPEKH